MLSILNVALKKIAKKKVTENFKRRLKELKRNLNCDEGSFFYLKRNTFFKKVKNENCIHENAKQAYHV